MNGIPDLDLPATAGRLRRLAGAGALGPAELEGALTHAGRRPTPESWRRFARLHLLALGVALLAAGVVFFVAANWGEMTPALRLGLVTAAMVAATACGALLGLDGAPGRAAALLGGLLFGPLMALYGQTYQTGADAWGLFATWAVVMTAYAAVVRLAVGWIAWLTLVHVAGLTFWDQQMGGDLVSLRVLPAAAALAALDAALVAFLERRRPRGRLLVRYAALLGAVLTAGPAMHAILEESGGAPGRLAAIALAGLAIFALWFTYRERIADLFLLFLAATEACVLLSTALGELLFEVLEVEEVAGLLLFGLAICAQVWVLTRWLLAWRRHPRHREGAA